MKRIYIKIILSTIYLGLVLSGCGQAKQEEPEEKEIEGIEALSTRLPDLTTEHDMSEEIAVTEEVTTERVVEPEIITDLEGQLKDLISAEKERGTQVSVFVEDLSDGSYVSFSAGQMQSANLITLFVAGCVFEQMDALTDAGNGQNDIEALVRKMITASDNEAANSLVKMLGNGNAESGMEQINAYCTEHGFDATFMGKLMLDTTAENDNYTSVTDCARFLKLIHKGTLIGSESILEYMKQQGRRNKIPAAIPTDVVTADKTGELDDMESDVAIIYTENGAYTLCIMLDDLSDTAAGRSFIVNISDIVYKYMIR